MHFIHISFPPRIRQLCISLDPCATQDVIWEEHYADLMHGMFLCSEVINLTYLHKLKIILCVSKYSIAPYGCIIVERFGLEGTLKII